MKMETQRDKDSTEQETPKYDYRIQIVWFNAIGFLVLHLGAVYGLYLFLTSTMAATLVWSKHNIILTDLNAIC